MSNDNIVFRKIKEMSSRGMQPRPVLNTAELARELSISQENLNESLTQLKDLKLISTFKTDYPAIKLTLLGTVVVRTK